MLAAGSSVSGYRVERVLGSGGMGTVYMVTNPELPRREALKLLSSELSRDAGFRARFIREATVAAQLEHPNIVAIHRRGETSTGQLWIAMQLVDGIDADAALRQGAVTPARALHIVTEVGKALDHAHHRQVVHRDVKPANFLLSGPVGPSERVLLGDFGIARALNDTSVTRTGEVIATVTYAAPEVFGGGSVDPRADLYSLGCSLYRMLTGAPPFPAENAAAVMMAHLMHPPPRVSDRAPWLPRALDDVIATAMAKDPAARFASAGELAGAATEALHRGVSPTTVPASVPSMHTPPRQVRRGRRALAAVSVAGVTLAAGITAVNIWPTSTPDSTSPPSAASTSASPSSRVLPPPVSAAALPGLLLTADELAPIMGAQLSLKPALDVMSDHSQTMSDPDCLGAFAAAEAQVYAHSGWVAVQVVASEPGHDFVSQAVVAFPTPAAAQNFYAAQIPVWTRCSGQRFTTSSAGDQSWTFGQVVMDSGMLSLTMSRDGDTGLCGRVMAVRANVVIDAGACKASGYTRQSAELVSKIAGKVLR